MVTIETIEGIINGIISYHYDVFADVIYLRLLTDMQTPSIGELNDGGNIELHDEKTNRLVGLTIVSWWKRLGVGAIPDSICEIQNLIEPLGKKIAS